MSRALGREPHTQRRRCQGPGYPYLAAGSRDGAPILKLCPHLYSRDDHWFQGCPERPSELKMREEFMSHRPYKCERKGKIREGAARRKYFCLPSLWQIFLLLKVSPSGVTKLPSGLGEKDFHYQAVWSHFLKKNLFN